MLLKMEPTVRKSAVRGVELIHAERAARAGAMADNDWETTWQNLQEHLPPSVGYNARRWHRVYRHLFRVWLRAKAPSERGPEPWWEDDRAADAAETKIARDGV